jgi:hypothetical protein
MFFIYEQLNAVKQITARVIKIVKMAAAVIKNILS